MRISSFGFLLALAACGASSEPDDRAAVAQAVAEDRIECAVEGAGDFTKACAIERGESEALILRHASGGFRRLTLAADGTIDTADGAEGLTVETLSDGRALVTVGEDRYRLPATL